MPVIGDAKAMVAYTPPLPGVAATHPGLPACQVHCPYFSLVFIAIP